MSGIGKKYTTGIITDGQIRRFNSKDIELKSLKVKNVMTKNPIAISKDIMAAEALNIMEKNGLTRGENDLKIIMMCEVPSNAIIADDFIKYFDGFSIGSNDLTQLSLGMDRDSGILADGFDERDPTVIKLIEMAITSAKKANKYVGICGQGPSDHPDFAEWLVKQGITSLSLNPDTVVSTWKQLSKK